MYSTIPVLSLLTLAFALPHDEPSPTVVIETIFVTITHTFDGAPISSPLATSTSPSVSQTTTMMTSSCTHFSHTHTGLSSTQGVAVAQTSHAALIRSEAVSNTPDTPAITISTIAHNPVGWGGVDDALFTSSSLSPVPTKAVINEEDGTDSSGTSSPSASSTSTTMSTFIHDPIGWGGVDDALFTSISVPQNQNQLRDAASTSRARPWGRLFVGAMTVPQAPSASALEARSDGFGKGHEWVEESCITCPKGRDLVCINATHFGYCDEGCVEPRRIMERMKCVDGRMYGHRSR